MGGEHPTECVTLTVARGLATVVEVDVGLALGLVPRSLAPVEVRPGVALVSLIHFRIAGGGEHAGHGRLPTYDELVFGVHVEPHLGWALPRFAVHVVSIGVSEPAAGRFLAEVHRMPVHPRPLRFELGEGTVEVADDAGPILRMRDLHPAPRLAADVVRAQVFAAHDGAVWGYPEVLEGPLCRHQTRGRPVDVEAHPFFGGATLPPRPMAYMQTSGGAVGPLRQTAQRAVRLGR